MDTAILLPIEEQMMFWQEHSTAITQFAQLEQQLAELVSRATDSTSRKALHTAFFGIEAFRSKLEFADRFVRLRVGGDAALSEQWSRAHERCKRASEARNKLVHWQVIHHLGGRPGQQVVLVPPSLSPTSKFAGEPAWWESKEPPSYALGVRQIAEIRFGFFDALVLIQRFGAAASGVPDPFPDIALPSHAPTLEKLVSDFRRHLRPLPP